MEKQINTVAALQIGLCIFNLLIAFLIFTIFRLITGFIEDSKGEMVLTLIANVIAIVFIIISIPGILAGMGLYKRKEWARILTLILSAFELFSFPFGTGIGIYSIWVLVQPETVAAFSEDRF